MPRWHSVRRLLLPWLVLLPAWLVLLLVSLVLRSALEPAALHLASVVLLALAPVGLLVFPGSVVLLLVCAVVTARCRVVFAVPKVALQHMAMAALGATALDAMATAPLHAMASAVARGETATGEATASLLTATMAMALPMATAATPTTTPTAPGDAPTGGSWFATETERGRLFDCEAAKAEITRTRVPCLIALA
jgi:hypothetical protein